MTMSARANSVSQQVNRRTVLVGVAGVVVGAGIVGGLDPAAAAAARPTHLKTRLPKWAHRWNAPIYELDDFLKRDHGAHYPKRSIMLTVDDGPSAEWTPKYLRLFEKHHIKVTFNMIGEQVKPNRHIVKAVASEGHVIANHTWTHDEALPFGTERHIHSEIHRTNEAIHAVTGYTPSTFRAPGGVWGPAVFAELARQRMMPLDWDIDPRDWALPGTAAIESAMLQAGRGDIILCHDGGGDRSETYAALKKVVPELKHRGLDFVTLPPQRPGPVH